MHTSISGSDADSNPGVGYHTSKMGSDSDSVSIEWMEMENRAVACGNLVT